MCFFFMLQLFLLRSRGSLVKLRFIVPGNLECRDFSWHCEELGILKSLSTLLQLVWLRKLLHFSDTCTLSSATKDLHMQTIVEFVMND